MPRTSIRCRGAVGNPRYAFEQIDICDGAGAAQAVREIPARRGDEPGGGKPCRPFDRRPRRIHPDQHRRHLHAAAGNAAPLARAVAGEARALPFPAHLDRRGVRFARRRRLVHGNDRLCAEFALLRQQGLIGPSGARLARDLRAADAGDELLEQLRALSFPGKADPAHAASICSVASGRSADRRFRSSRRRQTTCCR